MEKFLKIFIDRFQNIRFGIFTDLFISIFYYLFILLLTNTISSTLISNIHFHIIILFCCNFLNNVYGSYIRYFSIKDFIQIFSSIIFSSSIYFIIFLKIDFIVINDFIVFTCINFLFFIGPRVFIKYVFYISSPKGDKTIIFGAGKNGVSLKRAFFTDRYFNVIAFLDDNASFFNKSIDGAPIFKISKRFTKFNEKHNIKNVIVSTDKISSNRKIFLLNYFKNLNFRVFELQSPKKLISDKFKLNDLKLLKVEDFLKRQEISLDIEANNSYYCGKTILITGGAGSIGSQVAHELSAFNPKKIIIADINETAVFYLKSNLENKFKNIVFEFKLINVLNYNFLKTIFIDNKIDYVFHAAAYKHVPLMESSPKIAIINNLEGTKNLARLSIEFNIEKFLLVSTDKAVNPSNIMGASKRLCEIYISSFKDSKTKFITTRFGNVLGSNGSVIPTFVKQIENGGPVTVTDKKIERFFMTIPEASKLVLEACRMGNDNQIYIFDMGAPVKIYDLAKKMINIYKHSSNSDVKIKIIGLRPGEKMFEELLKNTENMVKSRNKHIFIAKKEIFLEQIYSDIDQVIEFCHSTDFNDTDLVNLIKKIVPEYKSMNSIYKMLDK